MKNGSRTGKKKKRNGAEGAHLIAEEIEVGGVIEVDSHRGSEIPTKSQIPTDHPGGIGVTGDKMQMQQSPCWLLYRIKKLSDTSFFAFGGFFIGFL